MGARKKFISWCRRQLKKEGGKLILIPKQVCEGTVDYAAYYEPSTCSIYCATKVPNQDWIELLAHEVTHHIQNISNNKLYNKADQFDLNDILSDPGQKENIIHFLRMERVTEINAIRLLKKFKIEFDEEEYIRGANLILFKYASYFHYGIWTAMDAKQTARAQKDMPSKILTTRKLLELAPEVFEKWREMF